MVGGRSDSYLDVVEMVNLDTMTSCVINVTLDQPRAYHTGDGKLVCGGNDGYSSFSSCYNIATRTIINLINKRYYHTSWYTNDGIYLLGGYPSSIKKTTELVTGDITQAGFGLQYDTR